MENPIAVILLNNIQKELNLEAVRRLSNNANCSLMKGGKWEEPAISLHTKRARVAYLLISKCFGEHECNDIIVLETSEISPFLMLGIAGTWVKIVWFNNEDRLLTAKCLVAYESFGPYRQRADIFYCIAEYEKILTDLEIQKFSSSLGTRKLYQSRRRWMRSRLSDMFHIDKLSI